MMGCFQMHVLTKPNEILGCYREKTTYMEMKEFWDAVVGAEGETVGFGKMPNVGYSAYNHRELLWLFGKNGWSDIMLATSPNRRVNRVFRNIINDAQNRISAKNREGNDGPRLLSVFILRPYDKYSSKLERAVKRALFRIQQGRPLFNEENEVPTLVPYIPLTDQHLLTVAADSKQFFHDEIDKFKKLIFENYIESTIHLDKGKGIDNKSVKDKESQNNVNLTTLDWERMEHLYDSNYMGCPSQIDSAIDYSGQSIVDSISIYSCKDWEKIAHLYDSHNMGSRSKGASASDYFGQSNANVNSTSVYARKDWEKMEHLYDSRYMGSPSRRAFANDHSGQSNVNLTSIYATKDWERMEHLYDRKYMGSPSQRISPSDHSGQSNIKSASIYSRKDWERMEHLYDNHYMGSPKELASASDHSGQSNVNTTSIYTCKDCDWMEQHSDNHDIGSPSQRTSASDRFGQSNVNSASIYDSKNWERMEHLYDRHYMGNPRQRSSASDRSNQSNVNSTSIYASKDWDRMEDLYDRQYMGSPSQVASASDHFGQNNVNSTSIYASKDWERMEHLYNSQYMGSSRAEFETTTSDNNNINHGNPVENISMELDDQDDYMDASS